MAKSPAAVAAATVDPMSRRARKNKTTIVPIPARAEGSRRPSSVCPKICMPNDISHLASGGCMNDSSPKPHPVADSSM
jgi:hypothetical protein